MKLLEINSKVKCLYSPVDGEITVLVENRQYQFKIWEWSSKAYNTVDEELYSLRLFKIMSKGALACFLRN